MNDARERFLIFDLIITEEEQAEILECIMYNMKEGAHGQDTFANRARLYLKLYHLEWLKEE